MKIGACHKFASNTLSTLVLIGLAHGAVSAEAPNTQSKPPTQHRFKFERYDARGGALFRSSRSPRHDDFVKTLLVDSKGRMWVGTTTGVSVYDGDKWKSRTFSAKGNTPAERSLTEMLRLGDRGPHIVVESPPDTIWLGGSFGLWRYHNGRYEEFAPSSFGYIFGIAANKPEEPWMVTECEARRYDGQKWHSVLRPYRSIHRELFGLRGIAMGTNGDVWIGGTVYSQPTGSWTYARSTWIVDQGKPSPPIAPLFQFDGTNWNAFGPPHGLDLKPHDWAIPEIDETGRIWAKTPRGTYIQQGASWQPAAKPDFKQWVLRERKNGQATAGSTLFYRDGENPVEVRATDHRAGEALDLRAEQRALLRLAEDEDRGCVWLGTAHGLYRIWREEDKR